MFYFEWVTTLWWIDQSMSYFFTDPFMHIYKSKLNFMVFKAST